jgi:hypothetical protein
MILETGGGDNCYNVIVSSFCRIASSAQNILDKLASYEFKNPSFFFPTETLYKRKFLISYKRSGPKPTKYKEQIKYVT